MSRDEAIRTALGFLWQEFGGDIPPEDKPAFFLTLRHILNDAVETAMRNELQKRNVFDRFYLASPN